MCGHLIYDISQRFPSVSADLDNDGYDDLIVYGDANHHGMHDYYSPIGNNFPTMLIYYFSEFGVEDVEMVSFITVTPQISTS